MLLELDQLLEDILHSPLAEHEKVQKVEENVELFEELFQKALENPINE